MTVRELGSGVTKAYTFGQKPADRIILDDRLTQVWQATTRSTQHQAKLPQMVFYIQTKWIVPCESTADEVSFEWSHHGISSTDSKVRTTLRDSISHSGRLALKTSLCTAAPFPQVTQTLENECSAARLSVWAYGWREICVLYQRHGYTRLLSIQ